MLRPALRQGRRLASRAVCVDNLADKYHQLDPKEFPRTARDAFKMNEAKVGKLVAEAKQQGERWLSVSTATSTATPTSAARTRSWPRPPACPTNRSCGTW